MAKEEYKISEIYQGGYSSLTPDYGDIFTGYNVSAGSFGLTTDPRSANILKEISTKLSAGVKQMEIAAVSPEIFDSIPQQQLKEVHRLSKLTGVDVSLHGPVIDTSGIGQQGFSEINREASERKIAQVIERSHDLNPEGNIPVTFHSAEGIPGSTWETLGDDRKAKELIAVNRDSGKLIPLKGEIKHYPERMLEKKDGKIVEIPLEEGKMYTPEKELEVLNHAEWDNSLSQIVFNKERADEIMLQNAPLIKHFLEKKSRGEINDDTLKQFPEQRRALNHFLTAQSYLEDTNTTIRALFSKAYKYGTDDQKKELTKISEDYKKELESGQKGNIMAQSDAMQKLIISLKSNRNIDLAPEMHVPIEEFAVEQSSKTFGNAAFEGYKKFKDKAPIVSIENPPAGFALSTGEDIKNLVEKSRERFVTKAVEEGVSKNDAKKAAEKLIGATWDVGHINMLRKHGFSEEEIIKQTEKVAPFVKHIHLSDNFGFEHTELPMGMGNVPIKEMMKKLGKKGFEAKKIIEAGQWWQHFQTPPFQEALEAFGSPVFGAGAPYWNQSVGFQQGYLSGYGQMLPPVNYETFGAGFSQLPMELGGQREGGQGGRMSGKPME